MAHLTYSSRVPVMKSDKNHIFMSRVAVVRVDDNKYRTTYLEEQSTSSEE